MSNIKLRTDTLMLIILTAGIITYANSLFGEFVFDDYNLIIDNPYIKNIRFLPVILSSGFGRLNPLGANYYRPLQELTYMFDYYLWKDNKTGYHITNLWFYLAAAIILFLLSGYLFKNELIAFFAAMLFAVHPLYTSAVTYLSGRADIMSIFFILASFYLLLKNIGAQKKQWIKTLFFSSLFFLFALLSKENALFFIPLLIGYYAYFRKETPKNRFLQTMIVFFAITIGYLLLRFFSLKHIYAGQYNVAAALGNYERILTALKAFGEYLYIFIVPVNLRLERTFPLAKTIFDPGVCAGFFTLCLLLFLAVKLRDKNKFLSWGSFWFFIWFLPVSNIIIPLNAFIAENWFQLPAIGLFWAISILAEKSIKRSKTKKVTVILLILLLIFYAGFTIKRNQQYAERVNFYEQALKYEPNSVRLLNNLGIEYERLNNPQKAAAFYEKALLIQPQHIPALNNLANILSCQGKYAKAITLYQKALSLNPRDINCLNNLGVTYIRQGEKEKALYFWNASLKLNPEQPQIRQYLEWNK